MVSVFVCLFIYLFINHEISFCLQAGNQKKICIDKIVMLEEKAISSMALTWQTFPIKFKQVFQCFADLGPMFVGRGEMERRKEMKHGLLCRTTEV